MRLLLNISVRVITASFAYIEATDTDSIMCETVRKFHYMEQINCSSTVQI